MGTAQRICSQFLHLMKTVLHQLIRDCYARSRMIHMLAEALHLKEGTIQQQAFFPVRLYASDTKGGLPYIHSFPIINKLGPQGIQIRILRPPKTDIRQMHLLLHCIFIPEANIHFGRCRTDFLSHSIKNHGTYTH